MSEMNFFYGHQLGAPALSTLGVGDLAAALDAALVNGFATQSATITVTAGVATVTVTGHNWKKGQRVTVSGVSGGPTGFALLNTTKRIITPATNTFTLDAAGVSNGSATGTILARLTGLGWGIAFTATNQRAYRSANGVRHYLMVNDNSNTNTSIIRAFTAMSAVTTGTGPFPTAAQSDTNLRWARPDPTAWPTPPSAGSYTDSWVVVGDDKTFYYGVAFSNSGYRDWNSFGEFLTYKPADAYNTLIFGAANTDGSDTLAISSQAPKFTSQHSGQGTDAYYTAPVALARAHGQVTQSYLAGLLHGFSNGGSIVDSGISANPAAGTSSPISAGIELACIDIIENVGSNYYRRGRLRGLLVPWSPPDFENNDGTVYSSVSNFGDILLVRGNYANQAYGMIFSVSDWDTALT